MSNQSSNTNQESKSCTASTVQLMWAIGFIVLGAAMYIWLLGLFVWNPLKDFFKRPAPA